MSCRRRRRNAPFGIFYLLIFLATFRVAASLQSPYRLNSDYEYLEPGVDDDDADDKDTELEATKYADADTAAEMGTATGEESEEDCEPEDEVTEKDTSATHPSKAGHAVETVANPAVLGMPAPPVAAGPSAPAGPQLGGSSVVTGQEFSAGGMDHSKTKELQQLVQHLYVAQARVQLEASEIKKAQSFANAAQQGLEEAANHVRTITAALQSAQQEVAAAAIRAQTAQLQLAAHDQLLFAARQDVDGISSQMVGLQAAEGISQPISKFNLNHLLERLKQPLSPADKPEPIQPVVQLPPGLKSKIPTCSKRETPHWPDIY